MDLAERDGLTFCTWDSGERMQLKGLGWAQGWAMAIVIDQEYIPIWILEMFETPLEGLTIVATHYSPSHCLVMFASETPAANKYPNRL